MNGKIEQNIINFINKYKLVKKGDRLLIALSGGADSIFMLHFFNKFKKKYQIELSALHINHLLRGSDSDEDELFCKEYCEKIGIQFISKRIDVKYLAPKFKKSIEETARDVRYFKLNDYSEKINATKIVTAHNLNDNTETMLLNLFRGSGLEGVSGIPIMRGKIIRPLLTTSKEDILAYLEGNNISFRTDKTNFESDYSRNFLRNEIIPKLKERINPALDLNVFKFSEILNESTRIISNYAQSIEAEFVKYTELGVEISDLILLKHNTDELFGVLAKTSIAKYFFVKTTFKDITHLKSLFFLQVGQKVDLSKNLFATRERDCIHIQLKIEKTYEFADANLELNSEIELDGTFFLATEVDKKEIDFSNQKNVEFIDGDKIIFPLTIRRWNNGDVFKPIGLNGTKTISDFLTEIKIKSTEKKKQLVLLSKNKIIWVVNQRIDESVKIKKSTKRIIKLWVK